MSAGDATDPLDAILGAPPCPPDETRAKAERLRARNELAEANLPLVAHYVRRHGGRGVEPGDLMQVGSLALLRAAEAFDRGRGEFGVFAGVCIRRAMRLAIARARGEETAAGGDEDADPVDPACVPPLEALADAERSARVRTAVAELRAGQRGVVEARFGLGDGRPRTLVETASLFGVSKQRIHHVEGAALATLRAVLGGV